MIATIISLLIFCTYLGISIKITGHIPESLSSTFYYLGGEPFDRLKASAFTVSMWVISILLLMPMLDITVTLWQFLCFLSLGGICFVGAAPEFREEYEGRIHSISAIISAATSITWVLISNVRIGVACIGSCVAVCLFIAVKTKTVKTSYTFWLEMVAFYSVYSSLLLRLA